MTVLDVCGSMTVLDVCGSMTVLDVCGSMTVLDVCGSMTVLDVCGSMTVLDVDSSAAWFYARCSLDGVWLCFAYRNAVWISTVVLYVLLVRRWVYPPFFSQVLVCMCHNLTCHSVKVLQCVDVTV
ncbi:hypothetical protein BaRGS_00035553 [Batillaria attramentaria]|uniref:Uncharacterized protein n=1 Tax=Batillaria attramentaria TaxID=370345 RepID=A0ABD0JE69_9CAEN